MSSQRSGSTLLWYRSSSREEHALTHPTTALSHFFTQLGRCFTPSRVTVFSHFCKNTISLASISLAFCLSGLRPCSSSSLLNNGSAVWKQGIWPLRSLWISGRLLTKCGTVACFMNWQQLAFRYQVSLGRQITSHLGPLLSGLVPTPSNQGNQYPLECHRAHTWDLFFSWSLSTTYLPVYLFQPSCMQMMLSFTSSHEKYSNRRAPYLTTLMTPSTDMPWNFKTPSLLLIYGRSPGMESLVLKKPRLFKLHGRLLHWDAAPRLSIGNQVISHVTVHKHLGVLLRQDLKWSNHIHEVVSKATRKAGLLRFMMRNLNDSLTIKLFLCYVDLPPILEYAISLWHGTILEDGALAMEPIQAAVARRILRAPRQTLKSDLLAQLNWPALRWTREIANLCLLHLILLLKVRASVCIWILDDRVFHTTEARKRNGWEYCVVRTWTENEFPGLSLDVRSTRWDKLEEKGRKGFTFSAIMPK